jgi:hypothetical protein
MGQRIEVMDKESLWNGDALVEAYDEPRFARTLAGLATSKGRLGRQLKGHAR